MKHIRKGKYVLWIGTVVEDRLALKKPGVSFAANRHQRGLLPALQDAGLEVVVRGHLVEPSWPRGPLHVPLRRPFVPPLEDVELVSYLNVAHGREWAIYGALLRSIHKLIAQRGKPCAIFTRNLYLHYGLLGWTCQRVLGIPWVPVLADGPDGKIENFFQPRWLKEARGRVFLAWSRFDECPWHPRFHSDHGVPALKPVPPGAPERAILFAGTIGFHTGVKLLAEAFPQVKDPAAQLWICGKGDMPELYEAARRDPRIQLMGAVTDEKLDELAARACAFVNTQSPDLPNSRHNFPSKLVDYLAYGKPVISSWTPGIAPYYREVLDVVEPLTAENLARKMGEVLARGHDEAVNANIRAFVTREKLWSVQGQRLATWLNEEVLR